MFPHKDLFFVGIQGLLFIAYLWPGKWFFPIPPFISIISLIIAVSGILIFVIALLQLNRNLSPFPTPRNNSELITSGLYKYIRHPIYGGILLLALGWGVYSGSVFRILIGSALLVLFYFKSSYEEELLAKRYESYLEFKMKRGRFFPWF